MACDAPNEVAGRERPHCCSKRAHIAVAARIVNRPESVGQNGITRGHTARATCLGAGEDFCGDLPIAIPIARSSVCHVYCAESCIHDRVQAEEKSTASQGHPCIASEFSRCPRIQDEYARSTVANIEAIAMCARHVPESAAACQSLIRKKQAGLAERMGLGVAASNKKPRPLRQRRTAAIAKMFENMRQGHQESEKASPEVRWGALQEEQERNIANGIRWWTSKVQRALASIPKGRSDIVPRDNKDGNVVGQGATDQSTATAGDKAEQAAHKDSPREVEQVLVGVWEKGTKSHVVRALPRNAPCKASSHPMESNTSPCATG